MKLASHLAKSRHGIFYFRLTYRVGTARREKRISLHTKDPQEARLKAACLGGIMAARKHEEWRAMSMDNLNTAQGRASPGLGDDFLLKLLHRVDREQLADLAGLPLAKVNALFEAPPPITDARKLDIEFPSGFALRDINSEEDMHRAHRMLQALNLSPEALAQLIASPAAVAAAQVATASPAVPPAAPSAVPMAEAGGTTIQEMVPRFATRQRNRLAPKTLYEYRNYHDKFVAWLEARKQQKHIPMHSITRADMADFIDDLLHRGLAPKTISQKYLAALSGLFELAQTTGVLPGGQLLVTHGHKLFTKTDIKKSEASTSYKPFTTNELKAIFKPELLAKAQRPTDFWLPMLGLFTGGRISELAQLDVNDIQQIDGIWAISVNDEGDKSVKTAASRRVIPVHPTLIACGFLHYVHDAQGYGGKLFPHLTPDKFGSYGGTPGERWGKYLDTLHITDPQKVFHSFRSTSNDLLKHSGVAEETRCQFIGHEHDTVNSKVYASEHPLQYLVDNVATKLVYPELDFQPLTYQPGQFSAMLAKLCDRKTRQAKYKKVRAERLARLQAKS